MLTVGVDIAKATLEAAAWQDGRAVRLGTFEQTPAGWTALQDALAGVPTGMADTRPATDRTQAAIVLVPTAGSRVAFALLRQQHACRLVDCPTHTPSQDTR